jgi:hypothetical protein
VNLLRQVKVAIPTQREDEDRLTQAIITLASQYVRYGYRRITALLMRVTGRSARIVLSVSGSVGTKVPQTQQPRGRLWLFGVFHNRMQDFGIRNPSCARESAETVLPVRASSRGSKAL